MGETTDQRKAGAEADERRRRARLREEVFGEVLPESTSDDRDDVAARTDDQMRREWLERQVPPHHGS